MAKQVKSGKQTREQMDAILRGLGKVGDSWWARYGETVLAEMIPDLKSEEATK